MTILLRYSATLGAFGGLMFLGAVESESTPGSMPDDSALSAFAPVVAEVMSVPFSDCHNCDPCAGGTRHETEENEEGSWQVWWPSHDPIHGCSGSMSTGVCDTGHDMTCQISRSPDAEDASLADVLNVMVTARPAKLKAILEDYPGVIRLNIERSAVQAYGCGGSLIAHLPLTETAMRAILN